MSTQNFTQNELAILRAMYASSASNGHDFGITEEIIPHCGLPTATARGTLREIRKKLWVDFCPEVVGDNVTQFYTARPNGENELECGATFEQYVRHIAK